MRDTKHTLCVMQCVWEDRKTAFGAIACGAIACGAIACGTIACGAIACGAIEIFFFFNFFVNYAAKKTFN